MLRRRTASALAVAGATLLVGVAPAAAGDKREEGTLVITGEPGGGRQMVG